MLPDEVDNTATLFHVTGGYAYVDPEGRAEGFEDVFTKLEPTRRHVEAAGLPQAIWSRLIR